MNIPIRLIAILPMLLLAAALIATACESATPDDDSQSDAIAAAPTTTQTPTQMAATQTPTATPAPLPTSIQCKPGRYEVITDQIRACLQVPNPSQCPPGRIPPPPHVRDDEAVTIFECLPPPTPTIPLASSKLDRGLNRIVHALSQGISAQQAAGMATLSEGRRVEVDIYLDRDPRELVIWLVDNGAEVGSANSTWLVKEGEWPAQNEPINDSFGAILLSEYISGEAELEPPYEGGETTISAGVPVSLLVSLSQRPGVLRVDEYSSISDIIIPHQTDVPPAPQEPQDTATYTPTPRATSQGLPAHGAPSWHQTGYKGRGVKIGIIDVGFEGFSNNNNGSDLPETPRGKFALSPLII